MKSLLCIAALSLAGCVYPIVLPGIADQARADCAPHGGLQYFQPHDLSPRHERQYYEAFCADGTRINRVFVAPK